MLQKEIKDWVFEDFYWLKRPVLVSCWLDHWKWLMPDFMHMVLEFLSNVEGLNRFLLYVLPKLGKITVTCPEWTKRTKKSELCLAQSQQNDLFENLCISIHGEARNIKLGHQINIIERVPLGTPPQAVVMSLVHNHLTNLFISSYRGAAVIEFKQLSNLSCYLLQGRRQ